MSKPPEFVSRDFRLSEFSASASHPSLVREVPRALVPRVQQLATHGLQPIRDAIGRPMRILSGYRSSALNRAVGGSPTSQHVVGEAADWTCDDLDQAWGVVLDLVRDGKLREIGQIIRYPDRGFVHLALVSGRFPRATICVHWPARGYQYRVIAPDRAVYAALTEAAPDGPRLA